jgi:hypothetical protein
MPATTNIKKSPLFLVFSFSGLIANRSTFDLGGALMTFGIVVFIADRGGKLKIVKPYILHSKGTFLKKGGEQLSLDNNASYLISFSDFVI